MEEKVVGTMLTFLDDGEWKEMFVGMVDVHEDETVEKALIRKGYAEDSIKQIIHCDDNPHERHFSQYLFIDNTLKIALRIIDFVDLYRHFDKDWHVQHTFTSYLQALCENHIVDDPVPRR